MDRGVQSFPSLARSFRPTPPAAHSSPTPSRRAQGDEFGGGDDGDYFGQPPTTTQVTITTDSNTRMRVNDGSASVADMSPGDQFVALFTGSPGDSIDTLVTNPALAVFDRAAPKAHQLYAFVGTVTATDTVGGTVTVNVTRSLPADLVPAGSSPIPFTVGLQTLVLGGTSASLFGGSLGDVSVGDIVAGGVAGDAGETLAQVESSPLKVLLDLPAPAGGSTGAQTGALNRALSLLGAPHKAVKAHKTHKHHKKHRRSHHSSHHKHSPKHARRA